MARPTTSLAAMILWEENKLELDDPITKYLPQFENQRVFVDASAPDMSRTRSRTGDITIQQLLTHSSGLGSRTSGIYRQEDVRLRSITLSPDMVSVIMAQVSPSRGNGFGEEFKILLDEAIIER